MTTTMSSGATAQDKPWKAKEKSDEARYAHEKEHTQLAAIRDQVESKSKDDSNSMPKESAQLQRDFEGGYGGQEDLEDRYATTSGEH